MAHRIIFILSFFTVVLLLSIVHFFYSLFSSHKKWKEKIRNNPKNRMAGSKQDFIDFYLKLGYTPESIDFVYCNTQKFLRAKDVVLLHSDDIVTLYERGEEEWSFILNRWLKGLGYAEVSQAHFIEYANPLDFEFLIKVIQLKGMIEH